MHKLEALMLLKLVLELLALIAQGAGEVDSVMNEVHSADTTGQKVSKIAAAAANVAKSAQVIIDDTGK